MRSKAFEAWLKQNSMTVHQVAGLLFTYARAGDPENLVWDYLKKTGDSKYTQDTFVKAAKIALGLNPEAESA